MYPQNQQPLWDVNYHPPAFPFVSHNDNYNFIYHPSTFPTPPSSYGSNPNSPMTGFVAPQPMDHFDSNWIDPNYQFAANPIQGAVWSPEFSGGVNSRTQMENWIPRPRTIAEAHFQNRDNGLGNGAVPRNNVESLELSNSTLANLGDFNNDHHPPILHPELPHPEFQAAEVKPRKRPAPVIAKKPRERPNLSDLDGNPHRTPFVCKWESCRMAFRHKTEFFDHIDLHLKDKDPENEQILMCRWTRCARDEAFKFLYQLRNHLRIHTGERPYVCDIEGCDRDFARSEALRAHYLAHAGLKPYSCAMCDVSYYFVADLNRHNRLKHPGMAPPVSRPSTSSASYNLQPATPPNYGHNIHPSWNQQNTNFPNHLIAPY